jgi:hypothetical protein
MLNNEVLPLNNEVLLLINEVLLLINERRIHKDFFAENAEY